MEVESKFEIVGEESEDKMRGVTASQGMTDSEWVDIQHRTFVKWVNYKLKDRDIQIEDLKTDLKDGLALINLVEVLSGKTIGRYFKKPIGRIHYFNNVDTVLNFIKKTLGHDLVNIGASDIVDGNEHCIMGLIWQLIQKYQARLNRTELLHWVQDLVGPETSYNINVNNFSSDWNDGKAACALVDACQPGIIDMDNLPKSNVDACQHALDIGSTIDVPNVIDASDMANPIVDELSIMTYVSGIHWKHPHGPEVQRAQGYEQGLYVEMTKGPRSKVNIQEASKGNDRLLKFIPNSYGRGQYEINITWKGKSITDQPIIIKNMI